MRTAPSTETAQPLPHLETTYLFGIRPPENPERKRLFLLCQAFCREGSHLYSQAWHQRGKTDHLMEKRTVFDKEGEAMLNDGEQSQAGMRPCAPKMQIA
jgi:hypothetical protein